MQARPLLDWKKQQKLWKHWEMNPLQCQTTSTNFYQHNVLSNGNLAIHQQSKKSDKHYTK